MDDLIARIEAATEGSRELDKDIARARGFRIAASTHGPMIMRQNDNVASWDLPHYTTSIDAALTLLTESQNWQLSGPDGDKGGICAIPQMFIWDWYGGEFVASAATPALALCAAALKARKEE